MSDIKFKYIGWCNEDGHDKVWIYFAAGGRWYTAWGRRGKRLSFKDHGAVSNFNTNTDYKLEGLMLKKEKGKPDGSSKYKEVDSFLLFSIFPDFEEVVHKELFFKMLSGKIK